MTIAPLELERPYRLGAALLSCVCEYLHGTQGGCPSYKVVQAGVPEEFNVDHCCAGDGQIMVGIVRSYPSTTFPVPDQTVNNCGSPYTVFVYSIQVWRCSPVGDADNPPEPHLVNETASTIFQDMAAMRKAAVCCLASEDMQVVMGEDDPPAQLGDHLSIGATGGCVGSNLLVLVGFLNCGGC